MNKNPPDFNKNISEINLHHILTFQEILNRVENKLDKNEEKLEKIYSALLGGIRAKTGKTRGIQK